MTISKFEQVRALPGYQISSKLFYKKYPYKINLLRHDDFYRVKFSNQDLENYGINTPKSFFNAMYELKSHVSKFLTQENIPCRLRADCSVGIFLEDAESALKVYNRYRDLVSILEGPMNEKQVDTMIEDLNVVVRKSLFHREYRYKLDTSMYRFEDFSPILKDMISLCENSFEQDSYKLGYSTQRYVDYFNETARTPNYIPYFGNGGFFFKNYQDVCTFHMLFKKYITKTTKTVLHSELKE